MRHTRSRNVLLSICPLGRLPLTTVLVALAIPAVASAQTPDLQSAETFGVLAGASIANTGATTVDGDVGVGPGGSLTGAALTVTHGTIHEGDAVAAQALLDASESYDELVEMTCTSNNPTLSGNLASGVYCFDGDAATSGAVTLTGTGPWIFRVAGALTATHAVTVTNSSVPAPECNGSYVFWVVGDEATIGAAFVGNVLAQNGVTLQAGAVTLDGRAIAIDPASAVTLNGNDIQACSFGQRLPLFDPVKVTGGGQIDVENDGAAAGFANYGFNAKPEGTDGASGQLNYLNHVSRLHVNGPVTDLDVVTIDPGDDPGSEDDAPKMVRFSGTCGTDCTFSVTVEDNGEPGRDDRFGIVVVGSDADESTPARVVKNGNIQVHLGLTTSLNAESFRPGDTMAVSVSMTPGVGSPRVDSYLVLQLPNGQLLSWTPRGFVPGLTPLAQNVAPVNFRTELARLAIPPGTPPGNYVWLSGHTAAGTLNLASEIAVLPFTIRP